MAGIKSQSLKCKDLHDYLKTLSSATLEKLYNHPATCLAVFRELPTLSKHYVTRLLFVEQPVPQAVIGSWLGQQYVKHHLDGVEALCELHIYMEAPVPGGLPGWILNTTFRKNLKIALLGGGKPWAVCANLEKDKHGRDIKFLDTYAMERWEALLHFMVGSKQSENTVSNDAIKVLLHSGLMRK
ncbi:UNVERIFIED_CONTAM: Gtf2h4 [Trichonephila clavipes]